MTTDRAEGAVEAFLIDARNALASATTIGQRSCRPGDGLNYTNHDRLIVEADRLLPVVANIKRDAADAARREAEARCQERIRLVRDSVRDAREVGE